MGQTAAVAVIAVLVGHVSRRGMSVHRAWVGVAQRAAVGRVAGKRTFVLGMPSGVQAMNGVNVRESGRVLLMRRMSMAKLQKGRFGGI